MSLFQTRALAVDLTGGPSPIASVGAEGAMVSDNKTVQMGLVLPAVVLAGSAALGVKYFTKTAIGGAMGAAAAGALAGFAVLILGSWIWVSLRA